MDQLHQPDTTLFEALCPTGEKLSLHADGKKLWIESDDKPLAGFQWGLGSLPIGVAVFRQLTHSDQQMHS